METNDLILQIAKNGIITEREINLIKNKMNHGENIYLHPIYENEIDITREQTKKEYKFLMNIWKTQSGKERKNGPFLYIEKKVLDSFEKIQFSGYYTNKNCFGSYYIPIYLVIGKNESFEYYYSCGEINIIG